MQIKIVFMSLLLTLFAGNSMATNVDEWVYKEATGNLKANPGCTSKEKATQKVTKKYHMEKHSKLICQALGYGWSKSEILDKGTVVCNSCGGEEYEGKYRCHVEDVKVKCKQVKRGW